MILSNILNDLPHRVILRIAEHLTQHNIKELAVLKLQTGYMLLRIRNAVDDGAIQTNILWSDVEEFNKHELAMFINNVDEQGILLTIKVETILDNDLLVNALKTKLYYQFVFDVTGQLPTHRR